MAKRLITMMMLLALPVSALAEDCYRADADDGYLEFAGAVEGNRFTGRFHNFSVCVCLEDMDLITADIRVTVSTGSADTDNRDRDTELHGEHFFHVEQYPEARWISGEITADDDGHVAAGELTLRGETHEQPVRLEIERDDEGLRLTGSAEIMRLKWNVGTGDPDFEDTDFIPNRVDFSFDLALEP